MCYLLDPWMWTAPVILESIYHELKYLIKSFLKSFIHTSRTADIIEFLFEINKNISNEIYRNDILKQFLNNNVYVCLKPVPSSTQAPVKTKHCINRRSSPERREERERRNRGSFLSLSLLRSIRPTLTVLPPEYSSDPYIFSPGCLSDLKNSPSGVSVLL